MNWFDKLIIQGIVKRLLRNLPKNVNLKEVSNLTGFRTYIMVVITMIYNILAANNIILPDALSQDIAIAVVDFFLAGITILLNYIGRKKIKADAIAAITEKIRLEGLK